MAEIHHFTYGWSTPVVSFLMAFVGAALGLTCTVRARQTRSRARSAWWLALAATSLGGTGSWLTHVTAMFGFDVPGSPVHYEPVVTFASLASAVVIVYVGLSLAARGDRSLPRLLAGALLTGIGVGVTHCASLWGLRVAGDLRVDPGLAAASAAIVIVASTLALWLAVRRRGWRSRLLATALMALGVCAAHYTALSALRIQLDEAPAPVPGIGPFQLITPITVLIAVTLIAAVLSGLQDMTEDEFGEPTHPGAHTEVPWQLPRSVADNANLSAPVPVLTPTAILRPVAPTAPATSTDLEHLPTRDLSVYMVW